MEQMRDAMNEMVLLHSESILAQKELTDMVRVLQARNTALQAGLFALISTHHDPAALFDQFTKVQAASVPKRTTDVAKLIFEEMQTVRLWIQDAASRRR